MVNTPRRRTCLRRTAARALAVVALAACALACRSTPDTAIRLEVSPGDVDVRAADIATIRVRTFNSSDPTERTIDAHEFARGRDLLVPFEMSVVPRNPASPTTTLGIDVDAFAAGASTSGTPTFHSRVLTGFRRGAILVVRVALSAGCRDMPACPADQTCENGACVPATRDPSTLPVWGDDASGMPDAPVSDVPASDAAPDMVMPPVDVPPPPPDMGVPFVQCTMPMTESHRCPADRVCVPAMMVPSPPVLCCRIAMPPIATCPGPPCTTGETCFVDPMGHAGCCVPSM